MPTQNAETSISGNTPKCPKCGSLMTLNTARKGHFAGRKFYGCPNWKTTCKGVFVDVDQTTLEQEAGKADITDSTQIQPPVVLSARERFDNYRTLFFQNMAVPKELLDVVNKGELTRDNLHRYGQWRLDFPASAEFEIQEDAKRALLVAKKILTRGRITILSPSLEEKIRKQFPFKEFDLASVDLNVYFAIAKQDQKTTAWFDGKKKVELDGLTPEHYFYEQILPKYLGPYYKRFVLPQVHFSSLIDSLISDDTIGYQRLDFLITTPTRSIAIELDDPGHEGHQSRDTHRVQLLQQNGFRSIRIENHEIEAGSGVNLQELIETLREDETKTIDNVSAVDKYLLAIKLAHQVQIVALESLLAGLLPLTSIQTEIYFDINSISFKKDEVEIIVSSALEDLKELMDHLYVLYGVEAVFAGLKLKTSNRLGLISAPVITFDENLITKGVKLIIQDISFPRIIAHHEERTSPTLIQDISEDTLRFFLKYIFRYDTFLEGQFDAISRTLQGKDSVILLPTGAGKSLAFQLASLVLPGVTIIIDPTTALIDDQIDNLLRIGIDRVVGITSMVEGMLKSKLIEFFAQGEYIFCYIAPQRLQIQQFRDKIRALTTNTPISLIAIDEAHCVSEWGHNFMTAYLNIGRTAREYCESHGRTPPLLALTGTASSAVLRDVQRELQIKFDAIITPKDFNRKELHFAVFECKSPEKQSKLQSIFQRYLPEDSIFAKMKFYKSFDRLYRTENGEANSGLVFCLNAGGSYGVMEVKRSFSTLGIDVRIYSGGKPDKSFSDIQWNKDKRKNATDFKNNKFPVMVATKSFGMGIDKPNIRYVVHFGLPQSIESFYQEVGRAGRDRKNAQSVLIISNDFKDRTNKLLDPDATTETLNQIMNDERNWDNDDDITRAIYLHLQSFRGIKEEIKSIDQVKNKIGNLEIADKISIVFERGNRGDLEKAIHRLLLLGVIRDYTIDYATNEFNITVAGASKNQIIESFCKYIEGYNRGRVALERENLAPYKNLPFSEFIHHAAEILIAFIYETIEKGRRRAFREMLSMSEKAVFEENNQDALIREGILRYLQTTYSEEIQHILDEAGTFNNLKRILDGAIESETGEMIGGIKSPRDAAEIRGQVARYLESSPDHPGLLFLRALSEIYCSNSDSEIAFQNLKAAYHSALGKYNISKPVLYEILTWMLEKIYNLNKVIYEDYVFQLMEVVDDSDFVKTLMNYPNMDENMLYAPALYSVNKQARKAVNILTL